MKTLFFCTFGASLGMGHLGRCVALAQRLNQIGGQSSLCSISSVPYPQETYFSQTFQIDTGAQATQAAVAESISLLADSVKADWVVVDDYAISQSAGEPLSRLGVRWMQFDFPSANRLDADLIVSTRPGVTHASVRDKLVNKHTRVLLGPKYAPLRQEFGSITRRPRDGKVRKLLVSFGGGQDRGATVFVLEALLPIVNLFGQALVLLGPGNPNAPALKAEIRDRFGHQVVPMIDPPNIAELLNSCDLAINSGGTSTYEIARCGIPQIIISIAENQVLQSAGWHAEGAAIYLGPLESCTDYALRAITAELLTDPRRLQNMGERGAKLCPGSGAASIIAEMRGLTQDA